MFRAFCFILRRMAFELPSFAKINWSLRVLGKREDGFHELCTLFQTVSLHDTLKFEDADGLALVCDDPLIPTDERNLILRAAGLLREWSGCSAGALIGLEKHIPSPGGLGGGSSNAAVALVGLCRLWDIDLDESDLLQIAASVGSDVPFFLTGGTAIGRGRGEVIESTVDRVEPWVLIVAPEISVSTPEIFASLAAPMLTSEALETNLTVCRKDANGPHLRRSDLINDLERVVFHRFPEVERAKNSLLKLGASNAAMSGSGASVFGIFDKQETRQAAIEALASERSWRKFAVSTVSRDEYARDVLEKA